MKEFPKRYNAIERDSQIQQYWQKEEVYTWDSTLPRERNFVIDTPPPTVSGSLHMGHVFSYTQADFVARYKRQKGLNVFYPMGFDDNGLPTERLVEKTKKVRVNTHRGAGEFKITDWKDMSDNIDILFFLEKLNAVRLHVFDNIRFSPAARKNYDEQKAEFIKKNHKDKHYDFSEKEFIPGHI